MAIRPPLFQFAFLHNLRIDSHPILGYGTSVREPLRVRLVFQQMYAVDPSAADSDSYPVRVIGWFRDYL